MRKWTLISYCSIAAILSGCITTEPTITLSVETISEPDGIASGLCENGQYVEAMRWLPKEMAAWKAYTERTGRTAEDAAGFIRSHILGIIVEKGDESWGEILDDPEIPYAYKTAMIFEILETRLGKGSVYMGNQENYIVPRSGPIDLSKEMIKLPSNVPLTR
jgi:hypothetical protein